MPYLKTIPLQSRVAMLNRLDTGKGPQDILRPALSMLSGKMALASSFGADSVVLLHMVAPLQRALEPFDAWITGRKQHQSATRADMATWNDDGAAKLKLNPLA